MRWAFIAVMLFGLAGAWVWLDRPEEAVRSAATSPAHVPGLTTDAAAEVSSADAVQARSEVAKTAPARRVADALACYRSPDCVPDGDDPRAGEHQQAARVIEALSVLRAQRADERAQLLAALRAPNGHIQSAALERLMRQPPDAKTTQAVASAIAAGHDAVLFEQAADWLQRAMSRGHAAAVEAMLLDTLARGSPYLGQAMADRLLIYLNSSNRGQFAQLLSELPPHSHRALRLRQALDEFDRGHTGGASAP